MHLKYLLGALISIPLLPIMYLQAIRVRKRVPELPEAKEPMGTVRSDNTSEQEIKLLTLGESTIAGVGVKTHEEGFSGALARELATGWDAQIHWRVYAKSGYNVRQVREELLPLIEEKEVDLIVIGIGANDAFELNRPWPWRAEARKLIVELQERFPQTPLYFCNMPPIKAFPAFTPLIRFVIGNLVEILGRELDKVTQDYDKVYYAREVITLEKWVSKLGAGTNAKDFFSDGVHPSKLTYQIWAKEMAQVIFNHLPQRKTIK